MSEWTSPSTASGIGIALLTGLVAAGLVLGMSGGWRRTAMLGVVAVAGLGFQAVHFLEHGLQLGYWIGHAGEKPWLTPWADSAATGLRFICGPAGRTNPSIGVEALHLLGNTIFMVALGGMLSLVAARGFRSRDVPWLRASVIVQGIHVGEHVALTMSVIFAGKAIGLSTAFGEASGDFAAAYRVWFHFLVNLGATLFAVRAVLEMRRMGLFRGGSRPSDIDLPAWHGSVLR